MSEHSGVIAFLSDFDIGSVYSGIVKGVIKSINPGVSVIDIIHEVPAFDVELGAFFLLSSFRWFPEQTIFLTVVDPGVGGKRNALIVSTRRYLFVGPDNGLIYPAAVSDGIVSIHTIKRGEYTLESGCETFHGRDVFAPVAAHLSLGISPGELGVDSEIAFPLEIPEEEIRGREIEGAVLYIDIFGNVITSMRSSPFKAFSSISDSFSVNGKKGIFARTFMDVPEGTLGIIPGSLDRIEICSYRGSAASMLGVKRGDRIRMVKE